MIDYEFKCEKENCLCCEDKKKQIEREQIKSGAIISSLTILTNQLKQELKKVKK